MCAGRYSSARPVNWFFNTSTSLEPKLNPFGLDERLEAPVSFGNVLVDHDGGSNLRCPVRQSSISRGSIRKPRIFN